MRKKSLYLLIVLLLASGGSVWSQKIKFTTSAPKKIGTGQRFKLTYTLNADGSGFEINNLSGFNVLSGPSRYSNSSISIVNGRSTQSLSTTWTYVLQPKKVGKFTLPSASITASDGKKYSSNTVAIEVVKGNAPAANQKGGQGGNKPKIKGDDLFVRLNVSGKNLYRGEHLIATVKLYTRIDLSGINESKFPAYNGFWTEDYYTADRLNFKREQVNGKPYNVATIKRSVLIPQRSGKLTIDPVEMKAVHPYRVKTQQRGFFFDPFGSVKELEKWIKSPPIEIKVKALPGGAPETFTGGVGTLDFGVTLDRQEVVTNEPISLSATVSGKGNLRLIDPLEIDFPADFEVYDPQTDSKVKADASGMSGSKTFDYLIIPRHAGEFTIPEIAFSYFNPTKKKYETKTAGPFEIKVEKGEGDDATTLVDMGTGKSAIKVLGNDIRYLKTGDVSLSKRDRYFFGTGGFYSLLGLPLVGFFAFVFLVRNRRKANSDVAAVANRKAGKLAKKHLNTAATLLQGADRGGFYKEVLKGIWGYLSGKLGISPADLNKESVRAGLEKKGMPANVIEELVAFLNKCEYAQFAPGSGGENLQAVYDEAAGLINKMEGKF